MPITLSGNTQKGGVATPNFRKDLGYEYPQDLNLRPNSDLHKKLLGLIDERMVASDLTMSKYRGNWEDIDKVLRVYISSDAAEGKKKSKKAKEDDYADIIIPESYATMETILTYLMASFVQSPMIKFEGTGPEDVVGARLLTHVIDQQVRKSRMALNLHTMFRDDIAYGFGAVSPIWRRHYGKKARLRQFGRLQENNIFEVTREERTIDDDVLLYEGNELHNINPYLYFPDPTVAIHEPEKGEFQAWIEQTTKTSLLEQEDDPESMFFNIRYLKGVDARSKFALGRQQKTRSDSTNTNSNGDNGAVDLTWMYVDLIPKDWNLGDKEYPEKWLFGVAGDEVIISAQPVEYLHGRMPVAVSASNFDGYSATPVSRLSIVHDVQRLVNFLYTSHIRNIKKALNDMWVVDPSLINYYDLQNPEPGKIIRARRAAWGMSKLDQAVKQFPVNDVTRQHIGDANILSSLMQRVSATGETLQGMAGGGGRTTRVSAREAGGALTASMSRFQKIAQTIDLQAFQPIAMMMASNVQQFMEEKTYIKVSGDWPDTYLVDLQDQDGRVAVSPFDLMVHYDVLPTDGRIPGSEDPNTWIQLYQIAAGNPQIAQTMDMVKIFKHIARNMGAKNVDEFVVRTMSDEELRQQEQAGNVVPDGQT